MTMEADRPEDRQDDEVQGDPPQEAPEAGTPADSPGQAEPATEEPSDAAGEEPAGGESSEPTAKERSDTAGEESSDAADPEAPARPKPARRRGGAEGGDQPEVVPGADLEPDLVLEPERSERDEYGDSDYAERYAEPDAEPAEGPAPAAEEAPARAEAPAPRTPMELAADARYQATGKRKTSVARVILRPGTGTYTINGRALEQFFPRRGLQATARQPLSAAGYESRMDVVARLHGGGVSSQAGALRHGVARALVEADPSLREDLKRRGYLTRDPRAKERRKAGLKKARKRPQFSKR